MDRLQQLCVVFYRAIRIDRSIHEKFNVQSWIDCRITAYLPCEVIYPRSKTAWIDRKNIYLDRSFVSCFTVRIGVWAPRAPSKLNPKIYIRFATLRKKNIYLIYPRCFRSPQKAPRELRAPKLLRRCFKWLLLSLSFFRRSTSRFSGPVWSSILGIYPRTIA